MACFLQAGFQLGNWLAKGKINLKHSQSHRAPCWLSLTDQQWRLWEVAYDLSLYDLQQLPG